MNSALIYGARALAPELVLTFTAFAALATDMRWGRHGSGRGGWVATVGLVATAALLVARSGLPASSVSDVLEVDGFAACFKLLMTLGSLVVVLSWMFDPRAQRQVPGEVWFLIPAALLGAFLMVGTNHLLILVLGVVLLSLASCCLPALDKRRAWSVQVALKALVSSSLASGLMIYGVSLLYGLTGTLDLTRMATEEIGLARQLAVEPLPVVLALILVFIGIASRLSVAALYVETPELKEDSPAVAATFFVLVSRVAGLGALLRCLAALFIQDDIASAMQSHVAEIGLVLAILAALVITIGNFGALRQAGALKCALGYGSFAQLGTAMIGVATMNESGFGSALVLLGATALTSAGAYAALIHFEGIVGSDRLDALRGLGWKEPVVGVALVVLLASWIGLPPTLGCYAKVRVFLEGWNAGLHWLVILAAINTLMSMIFVVRVAAGLFAQPSSSLQQARTRALTYVALVLTLSVVVFGVWTRPIDQWANSGLDLFRSSTR